MRVEFERENTVMLEVKITFHLGVCWVWLTETLPHKPLGKICWSNMFNYVSPNLT